MESGEKVNILLVDDNPGKLMSLETMLTDLNQNLVKARSGKGALKCLLRDDFAVILLDVNMPEMDGFETAEMIRKRPRSTHTPIIFVTAVGTSDADRAKGYELGAVDYIFQPVPPEVLRAKVARFVDLHKMSHALQSQTEQLSNLNRSLEEQLDEVNRLNKELQQKSMELEEANSRLHEADRLKSVFLASMSHELRTPLNAILGFTGVMLMGMTGELSEEQKRQLTMVKNSANHLLSLINDVLDISKIEAGRVELSLKEFRLDDIIQEVMETVASAAGDKGLDLSTNFPRGVAVLGDRRRVKQVLLNLASNAVKFTERGSVKVTARTFEDGMLELSVADTGIGIRKDQMSRLFLPFQQIDESLTKQYEGTGLGLYLSKKLADLMDGQISVFSEFGQGSTFRFVLPLKHRERIS